MAHQPGLPAALEALIEAAGAHWDPTYANAILDMQPEFRFIFAQTSFSAAPRCTASATSSTIVRCQASTDGGTLDTPPGIGQPPPTDSDDD